MYTNYIKVVLKAIDYMEKQVIRQNYLNPIKLQNIRIINGILISIM